MKTVFGKIYISQLAATCFVMVLMAGIFSFAIRVSVSNWNTGKKGDLERLLVPVVLKSYRLSGRLSPSDLEKSLLPYITDSLYVFLLDSERRPVLLLQQGRNRTLKEIEQSTGPFSSFLSLNKPVPVEDSGTVVAWMLVDSVDFFAYKANQVFISTMQKAVAVGAVAAVLLSLGFSMLTSLNISRKSSELADTIASPSLLDMDVRETGVQEFDRIAVSVRGLQQRLKNEEELRRQWMQDISHDLRTPVTAVKMQIEGMEDGVLPANRERFSALYSELTHIEWLVNNLQDLSRFESPEMRISPQPADPGEIAAGIRERFSLPAESKGIRFSCAAVWPAGRPLFCDPLLLQRCLSNIVQNALQYVRDGGCVRFLLDEEPESGAARIRVLNSGFIPEEDLPRIFNRLYRGDRSRSTAGSGLGLSIAKAVVALHGGSVQAENVSAGNLPPELRLPDDAAENAGENSGTFVLVTVLLPQPEAEIRAV